PAAACRSGVRARHYEQAEPNGLQGKKIVSSILSVAYLAAVIACSLAFFQSGSKEIGRRPPKGDGSCISDLR
ncbi:hypothetical protein, partial [uncultured Fibrobacter sp.]|uniref:hypothetical protein n=1 Tax=uncultured Fibrobacter sp. TaxID=261512 RepID=UPI0026375BDB